MELLVPFDGQKLFNLMRSNFELLTLIPEELKSKLENPFLYLYFVGYCLFYSKFNHFRFHIVDLCAG